MKEPNGLERCQLINGLEKNNGLERTLLMRSIERIQLPWNKSTDKWSWKKSMVLKDFTCKWSWKNLMVFKNHFKTIYHVNSFKTICFFQDNLLFDFKTIYQDHWTFTRTFFSWHLSRPLGSFKTIYQLNSFKHH